MNRFPLFTVHFSLFTVFQRVDQCFGVSVELPLTKNIQLFEFLNVRGVGFGNAQQNAVRQDNVGFHASVLRQSVAPLT